MNLNILKLFEAWGISKRQILGAYSKICLGRDMNKGEVDPEYACAVATNNVVNNALGFPIGGGASTYRMAKALKFNPRWREIKIWEAEAGDVVLSATQGRNTGHVGICGDFLGEGDYPRNVYSNNSNTGLWDNVYTLGSWHTKYVFDKKLTMKIYRLIL